MLSFPSYSIRSLCAKIKSGTSVLMREWDVEFGKTAANFLINFVYTVGIYLAFWKSYDCTTNPPSTRGSVSVRIVSTKWSADRVTWIPSWIQVPWHEENNFLKRKCPSFLNWIERAQSKVESYYNWTNAWKKNEEANRHLPHILSQLATVLNKKMENFKEKLKETQAWSSVRTSWRKLDIKKNTFLSIQIRSKI